MYSGAPVPAAFTACRSAPKYTSCLAAVVPADQLNSAAPRMSTVAFFAGCGAEAICGSPWTIFAISCSVRARL